MFILVTLTGLAGFGASVAMLAAGVETMALRYMLAMGIAYIVFLLLLWIWLRTSAGDYQDVPVVSKSGDGAGFDAVRDGSSDFAGGGGSFACGGASGNVDFGAGAKADVSSGDGTVEAAGSGPFDVIGQADEGAIPLAVILLALGIALSSLFVIWSAPVLFAEILVDALLAAGLYRRLRVMDPRQWMVAALKRTLVPFILTTLTLAAAGWGMQAYAPHSRSLGDVLANAEASQATSQTPG